MPTSSFFFVSALLLISATVFGGVTETTREFRPLEAKKVMIRPGARVSQKGDHAAARAHLRNAWTEFDAKNWKSATEHFVTALEADPECREAAEGLAISIYHTGDYASAYRLGEELKGVMPNVRRIIAETALTDVQGLIRKGEFADARSFLAHFPATGPTLAYAHSLVQNADTLTTAVDESEKSQAVGESLVHN